MAMLSAHGHHVIGKTLTDNSLYCYVFMTEATGAMDAAASGQRTARPVLSAHERARRRTEQLVAANARLLARPVDQGRAHGAGHAGFTHPPGSGRARQSAPPGLHSAILTKARGMPVRERCGPAARNSSYHSARVSGMSEPSAAPAHALRARGAEHHLHLRGVPGDPGGRDRDRRARRTARRAGRSRR